MGLWKLNEKKTEVKTPSVRDISAETRADIDLLLEDGVLPSEIAKDYGIPLVVVQSIRRMQIMKRNEAKKPEVAPVPPDATKQLHLMLMQQIQTAQLQAQLDKVKMDNEYEKEKRDLELKIKRLELREKELELEGDDEEDDFEPITDDGDVNVFGFLKELLKKQGRGPVVDSPPHPPTPTPEEEITASMQPDVTKPLPPEAIDREIAKATPADLAQIRAAPSRMVRDALRQRYPGITEENLTAIMARLKPAKTKQVTL